MEFLLCLNMQFLHDIVTQSGHSCLKHPPVEQAFKFFISSHGARYQPEQIRREHRGMGRPWYLYENLGFSWDILLHQQKYQLSTPILGRFLGSCSSCKNIYFTQETASFLWYARTANTFLLKVTLIFRSLLPRLLYHLQARYQVLQHFRNTKVSECKFCAIY